MLNGRYDFIDPVATGREPLFRTLGTPAEDKRHLLYHRTHSAGHSLVQGSSRLVRPLSRSGE